MIILFNVINNDALPSVPGPVCSPFFQTSIAGVFRK